MNPETGRQPRRLVCFTGEWLKREQAAFGGFAAWSGRLLGAFLGKRIPLATGLALALPATKGGAAVLADEGQGAPGHRESPAK